jgi:hypothetical protein
VAFTLNKATYLRSPRSMIRPDRFAEVHHSLTGAGAE